MLFVKGELPFAKTGVSELGRKKLLKPVCGLHMQLEPKKPLQPLSHNRPIRIKRALKEQLYSYILSDYLHSKACLQCDPPKLRYGPSERFVFHWPAPNHPDYISLNRLLLENNLVQADNETEGMRPFSSNQVLLENLVDRGLQEDRAEKILASIEETMERLTWIRKSLRKNHSKYFKTMAGNWRSVLRYAKQIVDPTVYQRIEDRMKRIFESEYLLREIPDRGLQ